MASEKKLDNVILGLLSHEDLSGYEIKKRIDMTLSFFWGASFGSIYPTLAMLEEKGYAVKTAQDGDSRGKQLYHITEEGRAHLREWLQEPVEYDSIRYETLLKLFFGNECGPQTTRERIGRCRQKTQELLMQLETIGNDLSEHLDEDSTHMYYLLTARFGMKLYQAQLEWCDEAEVFWR